MNKKEICVGISRDPCMQGMVDYPMLAKKGGKESNASDPAPGQQNPQAYQPPDPTAPAWGGGAQPPPWQYPPTPWQSQPPPWQSQPPPWQSQPPPWAYPPNPQNWPHPPANTPAQNTPPSGTSKKDGPDQKSAHEWQVEELMKNMSTVMELMVQLQMQETHMNQDQQELRKMLAYLIELQQSGKKGPR